MNNSEDVRKISPKAKFALRWKTVFGFQCKNGVGDGHIQIQYHMMEIAYVMQSIAL
jgi:hypothetical protein